MKMVMRWVMGQKQVRQLATIATLLLPLAAGAFTQAPMLDKLVQEKKLPPVDKRLPDKPQVIKPLQRVGNYGGVLRSALRGNGDYNAILRLVGNQSLVRWTMDFNNVEMNVAESYTLSADGSEYVFKLRPGMKWSDGSAFTAEDIVFSMNDLVGNKQFFAQPPSAFVVKDKLVETSKVDDYTVRFKFAGPYLAFPDALAQPINQHPVMYQKKYCSQFHPKYNPALEDLIQREHVTDWPTLMRAKCGDIEVATRWRNAERPTLDPWVIKTPYTGGATQVVMERNPYFWQVDSAGKQLPYIDRLQLSVISEVETIVLAAINGQLDFQHRFIFPISTRPVLAENAAKGKYTLLTFPPTNANSVGIYLNYTTKNDKLRRLIRSKDFRIALSLATDRTEINDIVYLGQGQPWQIGPLKQSKWYNEKLGTQYTQHDLKTANQLLDKLGLTKRDSEGFRQYPDGGRVSMNAIVAIQLSQQIDTLDLMRKQWAKAGIQLVIQSTERTLNYDRANANDYDISADVVPGGLDITMSPRAILALSPIDSRQSLQWVKWYQSNGKQGEEPTPSMKKRLALYEQWQAAKTHAEADALFRQILQEAAEEFEVLGIVRPPIDTAIRNNKLMNVYEHIPAGWSYPTPGPALLQQWFFAG